MIDAVTRRCAIRLNIPTLGTGRIIVLAICLDKAAQIIFKIV
ncbi:MAG: hypothetical protein WBB01_05055 [Phormidesmis sp.]